MTTEQQAVMEKLKAYKWDKMRADRMEKEIEGHIQHMAKLKRLISAQSYKRIQNDFLELLDRLHQEAETLKNRCNAVLKAINSVEDETLREVLEKRYLEGLTVEKIADAMMYSDSNIKKLHKKALDELIRLNVL